MAMKINAGSVDRADVYGIDPKEILVDLGLNARQASKHTQAEVEALARSILEHGQMQNALVRRVADNRVQIVAGYGRARAVAWGNDTGLFVPPRKLTCRVVECSDEEAYERNLAENLDRKSVSLVDQALAQRRLREDYGWDEKRIAARFGCSAAHLADLRRLLTLPKDAQKKADEGKLPLSVAADLSELPPAKARETLKEATADDGQVKGAVVRAKVREHKRVGGNGEGRVPRRNLSEVRKFLKEPLDPAERTVVRQLADALVAFMDGKITEMEACKTLDACCKE